jgi:hypothetical protein
MALASFASDGAGSGMGRSNEGSPALIVADIAGEIR